MPVVKPLMSTGKIKTGKQPVQLLSIDAHHLLGQLGPLEAVGRVDSRGDMPQKIETGLGVATMTKVGEKPEE